MHKRLPAECVTRRRRPEAKVVEEKPPDEVRVDLKAAVQLKPDARPKWLTKACKMVEESKADSTELYNIVTSRKFLGGLPTKIGRRIRDGVLDNVNLFSDKQQRFLRSEDWILNAKYGEKVGEEGDDAREDGKDMLDEVPPGEDHDEKPPPPPPEKGERAEKAERRDSAKAARKEEKKEDRSSKSDAPKADKRADKERLEREQREADRALRQARAAEPESETWVSVPGARGQEDRHLREAAQAEERARRKVREREEQEKWMETEAEASRKRAQEQQDAKKRQMDEQADSLMESLLGGGVPAAPEPTRSSRQDDRDSGRRGRGGLSRSRSIKARSRSRRRRGGDRRRRRSPSDEKPKVDFAEALRRRLAERENNDTTRIPVVDPGHAARWASRDTRGE